jgi:zinc protease
MFAFIFQKNSANMQKTGFLHLASFIALLCVSGLGLVISGCATAGRSAGASTQNAPSFEIPYEHYTLSNGMDVVLHKDDSDPVVAVSILFHVGSNREVPGRTGFAHFFEHMLFQASENVGKGKFFKIVNELGGNFNGGTSNDYTVYYETFPKDALEKILWMESDRMGFLINTVTVPVLENEKEVVKNEKRQRVDNVPYGHTSYVTDKAMYPEDHPYNWQVIGSLEDLQAATIEDVKDFYEKWYGPNNATLVIAGDIDIPQAKQWVEHYFAEIPAKAEVASLKPRPGIVQREVRLMHEDNFAQAPELRLVWPTVEDGHPDSYPLQYLGQLLYDGKRAPLYKELVELRQIASSPRAFNRTREISGEFTISVRANAGADLDQALEGIVASMARFEETGADEKDMERIKNSLETSFYNGLSSVFSKAFQLAFANEFSGSPAALKDDIAKTLAVTKADVMRVYQKYIKNKPFIATSFVPKGKPELALANSQKAEVVEEPIVQGAEAPPMAEDEIEFKKTPSKIDRTIVPPLGPPPVIQIPEVWTKSLSNNLKLYGIENNELPLVSFSLRIKGGMMHEEPTKTGISSLMAELMMEGTQNKTPEALQDAIGQLGASINVSAGSEFISLTGNCLARNFDAVMALVTEILLQPRWDDQEFNRIKTANLNRIRQQAGQPNAISGAVFNKLMYGQNNILAQSPIGTVQSVEGINLADLKAYYERFVSPNVSAFHVVGAVTPEKVTAALKGIQSGWNDKRVALPVLEGAKPISKPTIYFVDIPGSKQSVIRLGAPLVAGNHPDYFGASIINDRLGAGTSGRLFLRLREERGYTYGANSAVPRRLNQGFFTAFSSVRSNVTKESVELFREILAGYKDDYAQEDLDITRTAQLRSNALAFETLSDKMNILLSISTFDLPADFIKKEEQQLLSMTLDQAKGIIGKYLDPDKMFYLVVGDAASQAPLLKDLGFADFIMLDRDGNVVNN